MEAKEIALLNLYNEFPASLLQPFVKMGLTFKQFVKPVGEPLHEVFAPVYAPFWKAGGALGLKDDQVVFILMLFATYPLSLLYRAFLFRNRSVPKKVKELFIASVGLFICFFVFGYNGWHGVISAGVSWLLMSIGGRRASFLSFIWAWCYLSLTHLIRMVTDYAGVQVDYSALLMMMTLRIVSISFNYADYPRMNELDPVVAEKAVEHFPDIISYFAYTFYFPALLAGPTFEYKYFNEFVEDYHIDEKKDNIELRPNLVAVAYNFFMIFVAFIGFSQIDNFPRDLILYHKEKFSQLSFFYKMFFLQMLMTCFKFRYYLVWYIAQGACLLTGFGYVPKTKKWDGIRQANLWGYEFATSPYILASEWNISVHLWLKNYGYLRNKRRGEKPSSLQMFYTFGISAAWHGFYPGYYIFFFLCGVGVYIGRLLRGVLRPIVVGNTDYSGFKVFKYPHIMIYNVLGFFMTVIGTNFIGCSFVCLGVQETITMWKETYAVIPFIALVIVLIFRPLQTAAKKSVKKE